MPLIRDFIAEHDEVVNLLDGAVRAIVADDPAGAGSRVLEARVSLQRHWAGEENGIFRVMAAREDEYADYVAPLKQEHRALDLLLGRLDVRVRRDQQALRTALMELKEHISREEDGLFPASLTALDGAEWNASIAAWQDAHPGEMLQVD
jgi:hypothetical protein